MYTSITHPIIFAHRGASAHAPENTLAAFKLALEQGADGIELDAKLTVDGHVIVFHDTTIDRTTGVHGRVKDLTLHEIRALDAGAFFSPQFKGEKVPMLEEVFDTLGKHTFINVELTNYNAPNDHLVETVCMLVKKFGLQDRILFSSFFASNLRTAQKYLPQIPRGLLAMNGLLGAWSRSFGFAFGDYFALHPNLKDVSPQQVQRVHRLNRRVNVWTVNAEDDMQRLFHWGVDAIFTDDPQLAVKVRGEKA